MASGKTRQKRQLATRESILTAARRLIVQQGIEAFSLRELARAVDYSPAGLYEYFAGKEEIVRAVCQAAEQRFIAYLTAVPDDLPPPQRVVQLGVAYLQFARENPEEFLLIFSRQTSDRETLADPVARPSSYAILLQAVAAGIESGHFITQPDYGLEQMTYGCWSLVHGMATLQQTHLAAFKSDFTAVDQATLNRFVNALGQKP